MGKKIDVLEHTMKETYWIGLRRGSTGFVWDTINDKQLTVRSVWVALQKPLILSSKQP